MKLKRIVLSNTGTEGLVKYNITTADGGLFTTWQNIMTTLGFEGSINGGCSVSTRIKTYRLNLIDVAEDTYTYNIEEDRVHTGDAVYDIIAIPYGADLLIKNVKSRPANINISSSPSLMLNIMTAIAEQQDSKVYDIQLLPYCPLQNIITAENEIDLTSLNGNGASNYSTIKNSVNDIVGVILYITNSIFSFNIELDEPILITEPKIQSECDMYRLCSPNFGSAFEFNAAKNGGVQYFNVDCTYMPFSPYIHLNPNFSKLYGQDFNDARGLICGGEFSIARTNSSWAQYQLNNKNFQASFDRQIQSMELKRDIALQQGIISATLGTVTGTASSAAAGGMLGGSTGAIIGGILGGVGSLGAGAADVYFQDKLMKEDISLQKDMFAYQIGNIKAMPQSLSRTTAFTNNNKYFPVLEYYTCTDAEKEALRQKIKYRGMSINIISTIENFIQNERTYIKGKIIRIDDISEDFNLFTQIMFEIDKGIYIGG